MTSVYPGSPWKSYQRMKLSITPDLQGGILIEKDAGEKEWHDHTVGYLKIGQSGPVQKLLAGTYQIEWGQGLVFWGPYALAKSADPILAIKKRARGIQEFLYSDENRYLTGVTSEIRTGPTWITLFYSKTALDANLNPDRTVSSCVNTGLHRSDLERMKKDQLIETIQGGRVEISRSWGILGLTGWKNHYSRSIKKENLAEYRYDFQGDQNVLLGIDYDLYYQNYNLSGEIGHSRSNGLAVITNVLFDFYKTAWVLSLRHYARDFQNSHSNGFGVGETQNEKGIYLGWFGQLTENSSMSCYFDLYQHPWRTTRIPVPSRGKDFFIEYEQHLSPSLYMVFRIRLRSKEELKSCTAFQERDYPFLRYRHQKNIRFEINIRPTKQVHLKNRIEVTQVEYPKIFGQYSCPAQHERGFLLYQGIKIQLFSSLSIRGRWTTFDTHSYDSRIYVFEHDLPGILTIRSLYNRGTRGYLLLSWKIKKWFLLTTMYGNTYRHQESFWGSGNDKIMGDQEKKIGLQCDVQF